MDHTRGGGGQAGDVKRNTNVPSSSPINAPIRKSQPEESRDNIDSLLSISHASVRGASPKTTNQHNPGASNINSSRWKPPLLLPLPASFLRIHGQVASGSRTNGGGTSEQELPDEQFALMLQNEEFMNELRWNQVRPKGVKSIRTGQMNL